MKYEVQIANREQLRTGEHGFSMLKMTDDLDRAFKSFNKTKDGEYSEKLVVRIVNADNGLVIIESK